MLACINAKIAARKQPKPERVLPTGDLFRDELLGALVAMENGTLPLLGEGVTS